MGQKELRNTAKEIRREILEMAMETGINHIASSLSVVEILHVLFSITGENDKIILSKGHGCLGYYILLREKGYHPSLKAHPDIDIENGIWCTTGSLGHGLPIAVGMALTKKLKKEEGNIYTIMGDGECQEGTTWESLLIASQYKLDNLFIIVDYNRMQALDKIDNIVTLNSLEDKFKSFGCCVVKADGHKDIDIRIALDAVSIGKGKVKAIVAYTTKGKGISFMENCAKFHARLPNSEELAIARKELE